MKRSSPPPAPLREPAFAKRKTEEGIGKWEESKMRVETDDDPVYAILYGPTREEQEEEEKHGRCTNRVLQGEKGMQCTGETSGSTQLCKHCKGQLLFLS